MPRKIIPYNPALTERARYLRNNSTLSEILLWKQVKGRQIRGFDFHRQKPLLNYIVDFYCNELYLAIEIDGSSHEHKQEYDNKRQAELEQLGIVFLRFDDGEVKNDIYRVLRNIESWIDENAKDRVEDNNTPLQHTFTRTPSQEGKLHTPPCGHPSQEGRV